MSWMEKVSRLVPVASALNDSLIQANKLYSKGRWNDAARLLRDVVKKYPNSAEAFGLLGEILVAQQRYGEAEIELRSAYRLNPKPIRHSQLLGYVISKQDRHEEALSFLEEAIDDHPDERPLLEVYGQALARGNFIEDGIKNLQKARNDRRSQALFQPTLGYCLMLAKRFEDAIPVFRRLLEEDPTEIDARQNLAICLYSLGQRSEACDELEVAARLMPDDVNILSLVASSLHSWQRYELAGRYFAKCLSLEPDMETHHSTLSMNLKRQGHSSLANKFSERILEVDASDSLERVERGIAFYNLGRHEEAIKEYQEAADISGNVKTMAIVDNNIAMAYEAIGRYREAEIRYLRAEGSSSVRKFCVVGLANVYAATDRRDESETLYRTAIEEEPFTTEAWLGLGRLFLQNGNQASAMQCIQTGLEYEPSHADSKAELLRIS